MPAVTSVGYIAEPDRSQDWVRRRAGSDQRLAWENLFFHKRFGEILSPDEAAAFAVPLEMARLGPSASNKQPWRILKDGDAWHFYLQRTRGYGSGSLAFGLLRLADLQRVDMGIAMCHFELAAQESGLKGQWGLQEPDIAKPDSRTEYTVSWVS
jgi:hypothetical protein